MNCARVARRLKELGLIVVTIPNRVKEEGCPVTHYIRRTGELADAYVHPGDFGIEPTTIIIAKHPRQALGDNGARDDASRRRLALNFAESDSRILERLITKECDNRGWVDPEEIPSY